MWDMGQAIRKSRFIEISYGRMKDKSIVKRKVEPVAIMFSANNLWDTEKGEK